MFNRALKQALTESQSTAPPSLPPQPEGQTVSTASAQGGDGDSAEDSSSAEEQSDEEEDLSWSDEDDDSDQDFEPSPPPAKKSTLISSVAVKEAKREVKKQETKKTPKKQLPKPAKDIPKATPTIAVQRSSPAVQRSSLPAATAHSTTSPLGHMAQLADSKLAKAKGRPVPSCKGSSNRTDKPITPVGGVVRLGLSRKARVKPLHQQILQVKNH